MSVSDSPCLWPADSWMLSHWPLASSVHDSPVENFFYISHENKTPLFSDFILQQKSPVMSKSAHRRLLTDIRSTEDQTDIEKLK